MLSHQLSTNTHLSKWLESLLIAFFTKAADCVKKHNGQHFLKCYSSLFDLQNTVLKSTRMFISCQETNYTDDDEIHIIPLLLSPICIGRAFRSSLATKIQSWMISIRDCIALVPTLREVLRCFNRIHAKPIELSNGCGRTNRLLE